MERWPIERIDEWYARQPWWVGLPAADGRELDGAVAGGELRSRFAGDERLLAWDLYNEPGNDFVFTRRAAPDPRGPLAPHSLALAGACCGWARAESPTQPLTTAVWSLHWREREIALFRHWCGAARRS